MNLTLGLPWLDHWVLENPWPLGVAGILAAWGLWTMAGRRRAWRGAAYACAGLALAVVVLAQGTTTPRELVAQRTRQLVAATCPLDMAMVRSLLDARVVLLGPEGLVWLDAGALPGVLERMLTLYQVDENTLTQNDVAAQGAGRYAADIRVRSRLGRDDATLGVPTRWRLVWERSGDGLWRVATIQWLELGNQAPLPNALAR